MQVPAFEYDLFISYSHIDNKPLSANQRGWIAKFHENLGVRLAQLLGEKPQIWRDLRLQGNEVFDDSILEQLARAAVLVSVVSPRYVRSEWCTKELREFLRAAEETGGVRVGNKARLFKVIKTPIPPEEHPPPLHTMLGYEFYEIDPETGHPLEFDEIFGPEAVKRYWTRLNDLAYEIRDLLEQLRERGGRAAAAAAHEGATLYLAETTYDLQDERDQILRELQQLGHTVLPNRALPLRKPELAAQVRADLARCDLAIHLVGADYGVVPEAAEESLIVLQNMLAAEHSAQTGLPRLIWLPPRLVISDERQRIFVEALRHEAAVQQGADLLETPLEDLKTQIRDKLVPREEDPAPSRDTDRPPLVYLLCDERDLDALAPLEDHLFERGFEVRLPLFEGDEAEVREDHRENLSLCDAVLIYYGEAGEAWLRGKLRDLRKAPGYGRSTPFRASAVYMAGPSSPRKARFRTREVDAVLGDGEQVFAPSVLDPFVDRLAG